MESSYWHKVDSLFPLVEIGGTEEEFDASILHVERPILIVWAAHFCLSETHNGGLLQFFWNSTGMVAPEAIEAFNAIGMTQLAAAVRSAVSPLGKPYPRARDDRWDAMLLAGDLGKDQLENIFANSKNAYLAFMTATQKLGWDETTERVYALAASEEGGFDVAATRYLERSSKVQ